MKLFALFILALTLVSFSFTKTISQENSVSNHSDTCFYQLHIPADLDHPETPFYDTLFIRDTSCKIQIVRLPSQGTETEYHLTGTINGKTYSRNAHFLYGKTSNSNLMDITDLPSGTYRMQLLACGNGGGFGLTIK
jgi:hypothetical protein